jgi:DegV family protein with EDD domain
MNIKIITDSACDLPGKFLEKIEIIPVSLIIDGKSYKDGVDISDEEYYKTLKASQKPPRSSAPSPGDFIKGFGENADTILVFTISSGLSSSYSNAMLAKEYYKNQLSDTIIHVFDTLNASIGQGLVIHKLKSLLQTEVSIREIIDQLEGYIKELKTLFVLEKMDNLINSGRINKLLGKIVSALNIKLIMGKSPEGKIELYEKVRGSQRAFDRILKMIGEYGSNFEERVMGIAHYNCLDKAKRFRDEVQKLYNFKEVIITRMGPTIATYADEGGMVISF